MSGLGTLTAAAPGWLATLAAASLKAVVLLAAAGMLATFLRRGPARARQALWGVALLGALLLPALTPLVPAWSVVPLPWPAAHFSPAVPRFVTGAAEAQWRPVDEDLRATAATSSGEPLSAAAGTLPTAEGPLSRSATEPAGRGAPTSRWAHHGPAWGLMLYLLGAAALGLAQTVGLLRVHRLAHRATPVTTGPWHQHLIRLARRLGLTRPVRLLASDEAATPATWGLARPTILLPTAALGWSAERRRLVLLHELVHIRRRDWLLQVLARLARTVYWFNPLVWLAVQRLALEQERACDDEILAMGTRPSTYAGHLLAIASTMTPRPYSPSPVLDMARRSQMEDRLMSILNAHRPDRRSRAWILPAALLLVALVPTLAAVQPAASAEVDTATATAAIQRSLGEMARLEEEMEPLEAEIEGVEGEIEAIEEEMEAVEREMEPVEESLDGFDESMEPYEAQLEEVERQLEPYEERLEAIEEEMEAHLHQLEETEGDLEPYEAHLETVEREMEPYEEKLEALEERMEPIHREMERLHEEMEEAGEGAPTEEMEAKLQALNEQLRPVHEEMRAVHEAMRPLFAKIEATYTEMRPVHERMGALHTEMQPYYEKMEAVHKEMEPLYRQMARIHEEMKPVYEQMEGVHEAMEPFHQRLAVYHERMRPHHEKMGEIHRRMQPLHEEMAHHHQEVHRNLTHLVEGILESELAGVTAAGAPFQGAAESVVRSVSLHIDGGLLRLRASGAELTEILNQQLGAHLGASQEAFDAAVERAVGALLDLEVKAATP